MSLEEKQVMEVADRSLRVAFLHRYQYVLGGYVMVCADWAQALIRMGRRLAFGDALAKLM